MVTLFETDLQRKLGGPDRAQALREVLEQLGTLDNHLRTSIRQGLAPNDFAVATALAEAVAVSTHVIDDIKLND